MCDGMYCFTSTACANSSHLIAVEVPRQPSSCPYHRRGGHDDSGMFSEHSGMPVGGIFKVQDTPILHQVCHDLCGCLRPIEYPFLTLAVRYENGVVEGRSGVPARPFKEPQKASHGG